MSFFSWQISNQPTWDHETSVISQQKEKKKKHVKIVFFAHSFQQASNSAVLRVWQRASMLETTRLEHSCCSLGLSNVSYSIYMCGLWCDVGCSSPSPLTSALSLSSPISMLFLWFLSSFVRVQLIFVFIPQKRIGLIKRYFSHNVFLHSVSSGFCIERNAVLESSSLFRINFFNASQQGNIWWRTYIFKWKEINAQRQQNQQSLQHTLVLVCFSSEWLGGRISREPVVLMACGKKPLQVL